MYSTTDLSINYSEHFNDDTIMENPDTTVIQSKSHATTTTSLPTPIQFVDSINYLLTPLNWTKTHSFLPCLVNLSFTFSVNQIKYHVLLFFSPTFSLVKRHFSLSGYIECNQCLSHSIPKRHHSTN